jgi:DNA-directed RNA polymerase specialized sigma24 family protein
VRSPTDEVELWDAHGPHAYAFSHRVLGEAESAADAAQDAFLLASAEPSRSEGFRVAVLRAARVASFERLGRGAAARGTPRGRLTAATARLRPQQRAALALAGLERLSYAEIAAVLGIAVESVPALLARARLRLHDELHGTALAAAAVRSPDCEDVLPLLAAAADGELDAADAAWADPHVERCEACVRTISAMDETAATYAAWSPAPSPGWLRSATLADLEAERASPTRVPVGVRGALPAALLGATCVTGAFAALLVGTARSLHVQGPASGGARLPVAALSLQLAAAPVTTPRRQRPQSVHREPRTTFVVARVAQPVATAPAVQRPQPTLQPRPQRTRRPAVRPPAATTPAPAAGATPTDDAATTAVAATVAPAPDPAPAPATPPPGKVDAATPPPTVPTADPDRSAAGPCGWHDRRGVPNTADVAAWGGPQTV